MSDQSNGPGWAPPGDAAGGVAPDPRIERGEQREQPPPPPPPSATGGWAPPPPPGSQPTYGASGWQPPPPPRRTGLVLGIVLGVLAVVTVLGVGAVVLVRGVDSGPTDGPAVDVEVRPTPDDGDGERPAPEDVPPDDLEAQGEAVLETINASEERMIAFQEVVLGGMSDDGSVGDAAAAIAEEAQDTGNDLTALRSDLRALAGGEGEQFDGLRDIRDTYATHMDAWIEYVDAVAGSPSIASPDSPDGEPFWREIERSGDDFVQAVTTGLPEDLSADLQDLARFIVERGFGGVGSGPPGEVV